MMRELIDQEFVEKQERSGLLKLEDAFHRENPCVSRSKVEPVRATRQIVELFNMNQVLSSSPDCL